jgi:hypothetical protein
MAFNSSFSSVHNVKSLDRKAALQLGDLILPTYASKQIGRLHPQAAFLKVPTVIPADPIHAITPVGRSFVWNSA